MFMMGEGLRNKVDTEEQNFLMQDQEGPQEKPISQLEYDA